MSAKDSPEVSVSISDSEELEMDELECEPCNLRFEKSQAYGAHIQSMSHIQKMLGTENRDSDTKPACERSVCDICSFSFSGEKSYRLHLKDAVHQRRLEIIKEAHLRKEMQEEEAKMEKEANQQKLMNQLKGRLHEEDLEEFNPDSNEIYCKICDISCYGMIPFKMHLDGAKHRKKLERRGMNGSWNDDPDKTVEDLIDECREPLIGLEYVTEYDDFDNVHDYKYLCELCDTKLITSQIIHHLTGLSHRHKYYKIHDPQIYDYLWNLVPRSLKSAKARECAKRTEAKIGRKSIRYLRDSPTYDCDDKWNIRNSFKDKETTKYNPYGLSPGDGKRNHGEREKDTWRFNLKLIEKAVEQCNFDVETHIEAAIHVTNILIEALLKYKIKMLDKACKKDEEIEKKLLDLKKKRCALNLSAVVDRTLSQAVDEANKLAKEIVHGNKSLADMATSFLDSLERKLILYMEKESSGRDDGESHAKSPSPKKFRYGL